MAGGRRQQSGSAAAPTKKKAKRARVLGAAAAASVLQQLQTMPASFFALVSWFKFLFCRETVDAAAAPARPLLSAAVLGFVLSVPAKLPTEKLSHLRDAVRKVFSAAAGKRGRLPTVLKGWEVCNMPEEERCGSQKRYKRAGADEADDENDRSVESVEEEGCNSAVEGDDRRYFGLNVKNLDLFKKWLLSYCAVAELEEGGERVFGWTELDPQLCLEDRTGISQLLQIESILSGKNNRLPRECKVPVPMAGRPLVKQNAHLTNLSAEQLAVSMRAHLIDEKLGRAPYVPDGIELLPANVLDALLDQSYFNTILSPKQVKYTMLGDNPIVLLSLAGSGITAPIPIAVGETPEDITFAISADCFGAFEVCWREKQPQQILELSFTPRTVDEEMMVFHTSFAGGFAEPFSLRFCLPLGFAWGQLTSFQMAEIPTDGSFASESFGSFKIQMVRPQQRTLASVEPPPPMDAPNVLSSLASFGAITTSASASLGDDMALQ